MSPQAGYVNQATSVVIRGSFPSHAYVWFGDQPGQVVHQNRDSITVRTPLRAAPGIVDITLRQSGNGVVLEIPDAYAFVDAAGSAGPRSSDTSAPGDSEPGSGDSRNTAPDSSTPDGSDGGAGDDSAADEGAADGSSSSGGAEASSDRRERMLVGAPVDLGNGLTGASVTPNVAANAPLCSNDPCRAVRR